MVADYRRRQGWIRQCGFSKLGRLRCPSVPTGPGEALGDTQTGRTSRSSERVASLRLIRRYCGAHRWVFGEKGIWSWVRLLRIPEVEYDRTGAITIY